MAKGDNHEEVAIDLSSFVEDVATPSASGDGVGKRRRSSFDATWDEMLEPPASLKAVMDDQALQTLSDVAAVERAAEASLSPPVGGGEEPRRSGIVPRLPADDLESSSDFEHRTDERLFWAERESQRAVESPRTVQSQRAVESPRTVQSQRAVESPRTVQSQRTLEFERPQGLQHRAESQHTLEFERDPEPLGESVIAALEGIDGDQGFDALEVTLQDFLSPPQPGAPVPEAPGLVDSAPAVGRDARADMDDLLVLLPQLSSPSSAETITAQHLQKELAAAAILVRRGHVVACEQRFEQLLGAFPRDWAMSECFAGVFERFGFGLVAARWRIRAALFLWRRGSASGALRQLRAAVACDPTQHELRRLLPLVESRCTDEPSEG